MSQPKIKATTGLDMLLSKYETIINLVIFDKTDLDNQVWSF